MQARMPLYSFALDPVRIWRDVRAIRGGPDLEDVDEATIDRCGMRLYNG